MDANMIMQLVGTLGAPVVMCGALLWKSWKDTEKHESEMKMLNEQHAEDMRVMTDELHTNNVEVINKLSDVAVSLTRLADQMQARL